MAEVQENVSLVYFIARMNIEVTPLHFVTKFVTFDTQLAGFFFPKLIKPSAMLVSCYFFWLFKHIDCMVVQISC